MSGVIRIESGGANRILFEATTNVRCLPAKPASSAGRFRRIRRNTLAGTMAGNPAAAAPPTTPADIFKKVLRDGIGL